MKNIHTNNMKKSIENAPFNFSHYLNIVNCQFIEGVASKADYGIALNPVSFPSVQSAC